MFCGCLDNKTGIIDPVYFLAEPKFEVMSKILNFLISKRMGSAKINVQLACDYVVKKGQNETVTHIFLYKNDKIFIHGHLRRVVCGKRPTASQEIK